MLVTKQVICGLHVAFVATFFPCSFLSTTGIVTTPTGVAAGYTNNSNNYNNNNPMRAWTCHGRNQRDLVNRLYQAQIIKTPAVRDVMSQVDRQNYVLVPENAYMDAPQGIGLGQTISAPHMHAHVLEEMYPFLQRSILRQKQLSNNGNKELPQVKMLDVGCGSGYLTAAMGRWIHSNGPPQTTDTTTTGAAEGSSSILGATGQVFAIDVHAHLIDLTTRNMQKSDGDLLQSNTVRVQLGDGWKGLVEEAPFDVIHVGAAAEELPIALVEQLKVGGVLIIPVGSQGENQTLYKVERVADSRSGNDGSSPSGSSSSRDGLVQDDFIITQLLGVRYVPLVHPNTD